MWVKATALQSFFLSIISLISFRFGMRVGIEELTMLQEIKCLKCSLEESCFFF
jgi:hypothetical protein